MHSLRICAYWTTCMWHYLTGSWQVALASWHWHTSSIPVYMLLDTILYHRWQVTPTRLHWHTYCMSRVYISIKWHYLTEHSVWWHMIDTGRHLTCQHTSSKWHFVKHLPKCLAVIWHDTGWQFYSCHIMQYMSLLTGVLCIGFVLTLYNIVYSG